MSLALLFDPPAGGMPEAIAAAQAEEHHDRHDLELMEKHGCQDSASQEGGRVARHESQRDAKGGMDQRWGDSGPGRRLGGSAGDEQAGRDRHAAFDQSSPQPIAGLGQPTPQRPLR